MRRTVTRVGSAGLFVALAAVVASRGPVELRGQPVPDAPKAGEKAGPKKDPTSGEALAFEFPEDRESNQRLKAARDYLGRKDIPWDTVCSVLQKILDAQSDSFFSQRDGGGERVSVKAEANRILAAFPKEGLEFYQVAYGPVAEGLLREAVQNNYDRDTLANVSQRFFHTKAGAEATVLLGTIHLDRGAFLDAADAFERLLARPAADAALTPRTLYKAALAFRRTGEPRHAAMADKLWGQLERQVARTGLSFGRRVLSADDLKRELDRQVVGFAYTPTVGDWAVRGGNPARNAVADGGAPFLDPAFSVPLLYNLTAPEDSPDDQNQRHGSEWVKQNLDIALKQFEDKSKPPALPGFFPLSAPDTVVYRGYDGVYAVASKDRVVAGRPVRAGELLWLSRSEYGMVQLASNDQAKAQVAGGPNNPAGSWWSTFLTRGLANLLYENPLLGSLAHDGRSVYFVDDLAVPPPPAGQVNQFGGIQAANNFVQGEFLGAAAKASKLVSVNLQTGSLEWSLGGVSVAPRKPLTEDEEEKTASAHDLCRDAYFLGPPLPLNGRLYVLVERAGGERLVCLDPRTLVNVPVAPDKPPERVPALVWSQRLGAPTNPLVGDPIRRFQGANLAAAEGIVVCPTNAGAVVAVDVMTRSLLWAHTYRFAAANDMAAGQPAFPGRFPGGRAPQPVQLTAERWRAAAPVIANGRVVFAAYDSDKLTCLDLRTGKELWRAARKPSDLYVGGVVNDKVIVVGRDEVRALALTGEPARANPGDPPPAPREVWACRGLRTPSGHGVATKSLFFLPVKADPDIKDNGPEVWAVNLDDGRVVSKTVSRRRVAAGQDAEAVRFGVGNLLFHEGQLFAQNPWEVAAYPDLARKKTDMDRLLAANPKDPRGLTERGELLLDDGKLMPAIADFKEAQRNNPSDDVSRKLKQKLYLALTELLRYDFPAAEPFLDEYRALCELPPDAEDDPAMRARVADENLRRKGEYLLLMAKGRESQARLVDAFDHYLAYAGLGDGKELKPVPDEPSVRMRTDVLARSRIKLMIDRAADPAARRPLEDRVRKEWEAVRGGDDLNRLREFVRVFGPYFATGYEAQLMLAERLLATNAPADAQEAQVHLAALRSAADDDAVRARATEALARLMIRRGLLEDAVGLYLQLGKDYPAVKVRDGKTGADFLNDLLTDKRLLPYLEPSRVPWPGRVKAEETREPVGGVNTQSYAVEPDGELLPFHQRFRLVMDRQDMGVQINNTLRMVDRLTGQDVPGGRFTQLVEDRPVNFTGGPPQYRFLQASGHLLLVHLGSWVHCLDLTQKKELWRENLLGKATAVGQQMRPTQEVGADGEVVFRYPEGFSITLGRAAVLQPGYACLLSRGELICLEPTTGRKLWVRANVSGQTQLYGDGKYVMMVEQGADKKPAGTRLLRAADGVPVEGVADAAPLLNAAAGYRVLGRHLLLSETPAGGPKVVRLFDAVAGKDVWRKEFDAKAIPVKSANKDVVGYVQPGGELVLLDADTGERVGGGKLDEKYRDEHLKDVAEAQLFQDADRNFLVLEKTPNPNGPGGGAVVFGRGRLITGGWNNLRTAKVSGPMYCFDRASGKRLWFHDKVFENQMLITEQFAELPVVVAAAQVMEPNGSQTYRVVVVEKERGKLLKELRLQPNNGPFYAIQTNPRAGTIEFWRGDVRLKISADPVAAEKSGAQ